MFDDEKELDRRGFLHCMAWIGTAAVWTLSGGVLKGMPIEQAVRETVAFFNAHPKTEAKAA